LTGLALFAAGAVFGSFLNVVIHRMPRGRSVVRPPSACPACGTPVRPFDNVPILSYLLLRGRCRECGVRISPRYLAVEILAGALPLILILRYGLGWDFVVYLGLSYALLVTSFIDLDLRIIPDRITLPGLAIALVVAPLSGVTSVWGSIGGALLAGGALYIVGLLGALAFKKESMGGGDIKLAAMIGAVLGWPSVPIFLFASFLIGAVGGIVTLGASRARPDHTIPFGPFLAAGALLTLLWGSSLVGWYAGLLAR
jgi:leader peptidase (prepilin peptidase)/N-methyltransferase